MEIFELLLVGLRTVYADFPDARRSPDPELDYSMADTAWELPGGMPEKVDFTYAPRIANDSRFIWKCWSCGYCDTLTRNLSGAPLGHISPMVSSENHQGEEADPSPGPQRD
jgi:hypothetical protein